MNPLGIGAASRADVIRSVSRRKGDGASRLEREREESESGPAREGEKTRAVARLAEPWSARKRDARRDGERGGGGGRGETERIVGHTTHDSTDNALTTGAVAHARPDAPRPSTDFDFSRSLGFVLGEIVRRAAGTDLPDRVANYSYLKQCSRRKP